MEYVLHLLILVLFYTMLAQSLNLSAGFAGLVSLSHAGFFGIGAYTTAILSQYHVSFWANLPAGMLTSAVVALVVSVIALRTVDDYFVICTLGIQVIIISVLNNWTTVTNGPLGIAKVEPIILFGVIFTNKIPFLLLSIVLTSAVWYLLHNISKSGFGNILRAINEDEIFAQSVGKNVYQAKVIAFTLGAVIAAIPGALYSHYTSYIDPTSFSVSESIFILSIVIVGGLGNLRGSFLAAGFMVLLPEALRFVGLPDRAAANLRQIIYGLLLVLVVMNGRSLLTKLLKSSA